MSISKRLRQKLLEDGKFRCGYCQMPVSLIYSHIEVDHLLPTSKGGTDEEDNLWIACSNCNTYKSDKVEGFDTETQQNVPLFNPRKQLWHEHFKFREDNPAIIVGLTAYGRVTIEALNINFPEMVAFRSLMVKFDKYPPTD